MNIYNSDLNCLILPNNMGIKLYGKQFILITKIVQDRTFIIHSSTRTNCEAFNFIFSWEFTSIYYPNSPKRIKKLPNDLLVTSNGIYHSVLNHPLMDFNEITIVSLRIIK